MSFITNFLKPRSTKPNISRQLILEARSKRDPIAETYRQMRAEQRTGPRQTVDTFEKSREITDNFYNRRQLMQMLQERREQR